MTSSITNSNVQSDYYKDFTSSFMLEKLEEPHKANIRAIKNRVRGMKRGGITQPIFAIGVTNIHEQRPSYARALYQEEVRESIYCDSRMKF